jgi:hypothetical protein
MANIENLEKALRSFLEKDEIISPLASVLEYGSRQSKEGSLVDKVSYKEIEKLLFGTSEEIIKETLTWAAQWRLMLPSWRGNFRSLAWGDRTTISTKPETRYEVLRLAQCLANEAAQTGLWDPERAVKEVFKAITELDGELALKIVEKMAQRVEKDFREEAEGDFPYYFIALEELKEIFEEVGLAGRKEFDLWVVELKATDVMSPAVDSMSGIWGEFGFELNPSLFVKIK